MFWTDDETFCNKNVVKLLKLLKTFNVYEDKNMRNEENDASLHGDDDDDASCTGTDHELSFEKAILKNKMPVYKGILFYERTLCH